VHVSVYVLWVFLRPVYVNCSSRAVLHATNKKVKSNPNFACYTTQKLLFVVNKHLTRSEPVISRVRRILRVPISGVAILEQGYEQDVLCTIAYIGCIFCRSPKLSNIKMLNFKLWTSKCRHHQCPYPYSNFSIFSVRWVQRVVKWGQINLEFWEIFWHFNIWHIVLRHSNVAPIITCIYIHNIWAHSVNFLGTL
jgi:hypothetical protein